MSLAVSVFNHIFLWGEGRKQAGLGVGEESCSASRVGIAKLFHDFCIMQTLLQY